MFTIRILHCSFAFKKNEEIEIWIIKWGMWQIFFQLNRDWMISAGLLLKEKLGGPSSWNQNKSFIDDTREEAYEELVRPPFPQTSLFRIKLNTFRDLWRRGYYLTCGLKFGCDYLAYECVPGEVSTSAFHSFLIFYSIFWWRWFFNPILFQSQLID